MVWICSLSCGSFAVQVRMGERAVRVLILEILDSDFRIARGEEARAPLELDLPGFGLVPPTSVAGSSHFFSRSHCSDVAKTTSHLVSSNIPRIPLTSSDDNLRLPPWSTFNIQSQRARDFLFSMGKSRGFATENSTNGWGV